MSDTSSDADLIPDDHPAVAPPGPAPAPAAHSDADLIPDEDIEPVDDPSLAANPKQIARASLATTPEVEMQRYAKQFGQPIEDFKLHGDKIVRKVPETGTWAYVQPGFWSPKGSGEGLGARAMRKLDWTASGAGPAIPISAGAGAGALAGLASLPAGPVVAGVDAVTSSSLAAAGAEGGRQKLDRWLDDDTETPTDWGNIGWHALQAGATEPVSLVLKGLGGLAARLPGVRQILEKRGFNQQEVEKRALEAAHDEHPLSFLPEDVLGDIHQYLDGQWQHMAQVARDAQAMGIDTLSLGQKTNSPVLKKVERWLAGTPEGAERMGRTRQLQNEIQVPGAARQTLDEVAPGTGDNAVEEFRDATGKIITGAKKARAVKAKSAYADALDDPENPLHYSDELKEVLGRVQKIAPNALKDAQNMAEARGEPFPPFFDVNAAGDPVLNGTQPNWRAMDYVKRALDGVRKSDTNAMGDIGNKGSVANDLKSQMLGILDPMNPKYAAARAQFGESSDAIDQILKGGLGKIQRMTGPDRINMLDQVFSGSRNSLNAKDVGKVRDLFVKAGKEDEWKNATRAYLEDGLDESLRLNQNGGETGNVAGKMLGYWNTDRQRAVLRAAIGDPAKASKVARFMDVMEATSRMLPEGSPTNPNAEMSKKAGNKLMGAVRGAYDTMTGHGLVDRGLAAIDDHLQKIAEPAARRKLLDFVMSPNSDRELEKFLTAMPRIRAIQRSQAARDRATVQIGRLIGAAGVPAALGYSGSNN